MLNRFFQFPYMEHSRESITIKLRIQFLTFSSDVTASVLSSPKVKDVKCISFTRTEVKEVCAEGQI